MTQTQSNYPIKVTIFRKLLIVFISFTLIPMFFVGYVSFVWAKNDLTKAQMSKLKVIADLKVDKIVSYFRHLDAEMRMAQDFWNIKKNLPIISAYTNDKSNPEYIGAKQALDSQFRIFQELNRYVNFVLINPKGELVYETNHWHVHGTDWTKVWQGVSRKSKTEIYHSPIFEYGETTKKYGMMVAAPAYDERGKTIGVIAIEIDMVPIYDAIQDSIGLGKTGEALVVEKRGDEVVFMSPLRYDKSHVLSTGVKFGSVKGVAAQYAVSRQNGAGITTDYSGRQVLSVWRYVPFLNWGFVVKIDVDEAFATVNVFERFFWFLIIIALLTGVLAAYTIARSFAGPIRRLHKGTEIIGSGDLDYKVGTDSPDEIGQLSRSFDAMISNLKKVTASRDDLNQAIRERDKIEKELVIANKALESVNKAKSEFLSMMSHEIRTPLNSIIGFSEVLVDETFGKLNEKQKEYINDVMTSGQHLLLLINDVLDISKVEAGKMELKLSEINVKSVIDNSMVMVKEMAMSHNVKLIGNISESIGNIEADERKLKQILYNLFSNAIKFTPDGGKVGVDAKKIDNNEILIEVWDTGIGIEEKDKSKIFVEFKQIDSELSRKYTGTGLGLALVKKLVELHGGKVGFESEGKDKGTKFSFTLPVKQK